MPAISLLRRSFRTALEHSSSISSEASTSTRAGRVPRNLVARDGTGDDTDDASDHVINILLIVLGIAFLALIMVSIFVLVRRTRLRRGGACEESALPTYNEIKLGHPNHRALKIETTHNGRSSIVVIRSHDAKPMLRTPNAPPHSPDNVPEIHITFPDEHDEQGRRKSGRVVVVRVGENATVGLEPMAEEQLPAYEKEAKDQFYSIDFDDIGGLREKEYSVLDK